jgi:hypothetical protein
MAFCPKGLVTIKAKKSPRTLRTMKARRLSRATDVVELLREERGRR